jgi:hypothetical protein
VPHCSQEMRDSTACNLLIADVMAELKAVPRG